jgi:hypothetical protein
LVSTCLRRGASRPATRSEPAVRRAEAERHAPGPVVAERHGAIVERSRPRSARRQSLTPDTTLTRRAHTQTVPRRRCTDNGQITRPSPHRTQSTCNDIGTQVSCSGKVAGLGGTTFTITVTAQGTASVTCTNPAGNVAPGQSFSFAAAGSSGPFATPRNGQASYTVTTTAPTAPAGSCPNPKWTATVTDVAFTTATLSLFEDSTLSDQETVPVT